MFKVIVLACHIAMPNDCWEYHDNRGPYEEFSKCVSRAYEMANDIRQINRGIIMPRQFKCVPLKGTQL